jgi:hypothetical protein
MGSRPSRSSRCVVSHAGFARSDIVQRTLLRKRERTQGRRASPPLSETHPPRASAGGALAPCAGRLISHPPRSRNVLIPWARPSPAPGDRQLSSGRGYCGQSGGSTFEVPDRSFVLRSQGARSIFAKSSFSARICTLNHFLPPEKPTNTWSPDAHDELRLKFLSRRRRKGIT